MRVIYFLFLMLMTISSHSQSLERRLIKICQLNDFETIDSEIKDLVLLSDSLSEYDVKALINYEIINDFRAYLYEVKFSTKHLNTKFEGSTILKYRMKIISKNNQIAFYEIEQGTSDINDNWNVKQYLIRNCGTKLYSELNEQHRLIYDSNLSILSIFNTSKLYVAKDKKHSCFDGCRYEEKREEFQQAIENQDTTTLLNWLKSGNISLQLYAIEGIFQLSENGIEFPPNTWYFIQLIQNKKGKIFFVHNDNFSMESISILVQQIKSKNRKGKRNIKKINKGIELKS